MALAQPIEGAHFELARLPFEIGDCSRALPEKSTLEPPSDYGHLACKVFI